MHTAKPVVYHALSISIFLIYFFPKLALLADMIKLKISAFGRMSSSFLSATAHVQQKMHSLMCVKSLSTLNAQRTQKMASFSLSRER